MNDIFNTCAEVTKPIYNTNSCYQMTLTESDYDAIVAKISANIDEFEYDEFDIIYHKNGFDLELEGSVTSDFKEEIGDTYRGMTERWMEVVHRSLSIHEFRAFDKDGDEVAVNFDEDKLTKRFDF